MILPTKQIPPSKSLLGIGGLLLSRLRRSATVSSLWHSVRDEKSIGSFERFLLVLTMLHAIGLVEWEDGLLVRKNINAKKNQQ